MPTSSTAGCCWPPVKALRRGGRNHAARAHLGLSELHKAAGRAAAALHHHEANHAAERAQFNTDSAAK